MKMGQKGVVEGMGTDSLTGLLPCPAVVAAGDEFA